MNLFIALTIFLIQMGLYYLIWHFIKKQVGIIRDGLHSKKTIVTLCLAALSGILVVFSVFYLLYWTVITDMGI